MTKLERHQKYISKTSQKTSKAPQKRPKKIWKTSKHGICKKIWKIYEIEEKKNLNKTNLKRYQSMKRYKNIAVEKIQD